MSEPQPQPSKLPLSTLVSRVVTLASLVVSIVILKVTSKTYQIESYKVTVRYKDIYAYRYMIVCMIVGFAYTLLQTPFAIYHFKTGKRLINRYGFLKFDLYGDKVLSLLLGTGVGAAYGATLDLKRTVDNTKIYEKYFNYTGFEDYRTQLDDFFNMVYISSGLLLIAFVCSAICSIISSLNLAKRS